MVLVVMRMCFLFWKIEGDMAVAEVMAMSALTMVGFSKQK